MVVSGDALVSMELWFRSLSIFFCSQSWSEVSVPRSLLFSNALEFRRFVSTLLSVCTPTSCLATFSRRFFYSINSTFLSPNPVLYYRFVSDMFFHNWKSFKSLVFNFCCCFPLEARRWRIFFLGRRTLVRFDAGDNVLSRSWSVEVTSGIARAFLSPFRPFVALLLLLRLLSGLPRFDLDDSMLPPSSN